ncbi:MAG: hypothetical protein Fur0022_34670 [Anaerolineales bacterium]
MDLLYLTDTKIPSRSTSSIQVMRMCSAFQQVGLNVTLLAPQYQMQMPEGFEGDIGEFYGVQNLFCLEQFSTPLSPRLAEIRLLSIAFRLFPYISRIRKIIARSNSPLVIYGRSALGVWLARYLKRIHYKKVKGVFLELHDFPSDPFSQQLCQSLDGLVTISQALKDELVRKIAIAPSKILVAHDGAEIVSVDPLEQIRAKQWVCERHGFDVQKPIILYTGRLLKEKGAELILEVVQRLSGHHYQFLLVGKVYNESYTLQVKNNHWKHVVLTGFVPPAQISTYLQASDVVLLPSTPDLPYARYMSPLKLFEYMAAEKPILASDLPVIREVLKTGQNALLLSPYEPDVWGEAIDMILESPPLARRLAAQAAQDVKEYSWKKRGMKIINFFKEQIQKEALDSQYA